MVWRLRTCHVSGTPEDRYEGSASQIWAYSPYACTTSRPRCLTRADGDACSREKWPQRPADLVCAVARLHALLRLDHKVDAVREPFGKLLRPTFSVKPSRLAYRLLWSLPPSSNTVSSWVESLTLPICNALIRRLRSDVLKEVGTEASIYMKSIEVDTLILHC